MEREVCGVNPLRQFAWVLTDFIWTPCAQAFLAAVEEPAAEKGTLGKWLLPGVSFLGTASYAIAGTQVAGEAGMNVIGCCLVGIISSLGGGSVNALLYGYGKNGVPWARDAGKNNNLFIGQSPSIHSRQNTVAASRPRMRP